MGKTLPYAAVNVLYIRVLIWQNQYNIVKLNNKIKKKKVGFNQVQGDPVTSEI